MIIRRAALAAIVAVLAITAPAAAVEPIDNDVMGQYQSADGSMHLDLSSGTYNIYPADANGRGKLGTYKAWGGQWAYLPSAGEGPNEYGSYRWNGPGTLIITTNGSGTQVWNRTSPVPGNFGNGQMLNDPRTGLPCPSGGCVTNGFVGKYARSGGIVGPTGAGAMFEQSGGGNPAGQAAARMLNGMTGGNAGQYANPSANPYQNPGNPWGNLINQFANPGGASAPNSGNQPNTNPGW